MSAGIVFKSETHVLMGYQSDKQMISGIGGKPIGSETTIQTAFRETIEELFGIQPSRWLLDSLLRYFSKSGNTVMNSGYTMFIYSLDDLVEFLCLMREFVGTSPYYVEFPVNIEDLLLTRRAPLTVEVTHLCLIPLILTPFRVDQRDMNIIA
jgi:hypothetical protein